MSMPDRDNGRGHRRRDDRKLPTVPLDPNAPHSSVVKAQNHDACQMMLAETRASIKHRRARLHDLTLIVESVKMATARGTATKDNAELRCGHHAHLVMARAIANHECAVQEFMGLPVVVRDDYPPCMFQVFDVKYGPLTEGYVSTQT